VVARVEIDFFFFKVAQWDIHAMLFDVTSMKKIKTTKKINQNKNKHYYKMWV